MRSTSTERAITDKAVAYRQRLQKMFRTFLSGRPGTPHWKQAVMARLQGRNDVFVPALQMPPDALTVDTLCALVEVNKTTVAILHSRQAIEGPEGVGRTSLLLRLLRISFNYTQILPDPDKSIQVLYEIHRTIQSNVKLLTADFAYIASFEGRLLVLPVLAEPLLGLWDVARHIYRMIVEDYQPGLRLTPKGRAMLYALMSAIPAELILECYGAWQESYAVDIAVILEIDPAASSPKAVSFAETRKAHDALKRAFDSVRYLTTAFWDRKPCVHSRLVDEILRGVTVLPEVHRISVPIGITGPDERGRYLDRLFEQFSSILSGRCGEETVEKHRGGCFMSC